jgi:hypothetical protein
MIFDDVVELPGCLWTQRHSDQGFARRPSAACFATLIESGLASLCIQTGAFTPPAQMDRAIAVPFTVESGLVHIQGPEELDVARDVALQPGHYRLTAAQSLSAAGELSIVLCFEHLIKPSSASTILVADAGLSPSYPLEEASEVA